jgi:enolase-phosphatase E1
MKRGILLDIEGTTTPITFVYTVLFPYARQHMSAYFSKANLADLELEYLQDVRAGNNPAGSPHDLLPYVYWLMDQDRKSTALKRIQGEIWLKGYQSGELHGEVFDDVSPALEQWHRRGIDVRIFSSGSILAQRLIFSTTAAGDLTRYLSGYFDTTTGPKNDPSSYEKIAEVFRLPASNVLFVSDVTRELDAARSAEMKTRLCVRPGNHPQPSHTHQVIASFNEIIEPDHLWPDNNR